MSTISNEIARAKNLNGAKESTFKGVTPRTTERNTLREGDIIIIPADYVCLEQEVRNGTARRDASGKLVKPVAKYLFVNVKRDGKDIVVAFYPTAFWKRREIATIIPDESDPTKELYVGTGEYKAASGDAAEFVQSYPDLDEALKAIAGKEILIGRTEILSMPYQVNELPVTEENTRRVQDSVLSFNFVKKG